jgi:uncharacterized membrane protein
VPSEHLPHDGRGADDGPRSAYLRLVATGTAVERTAAFSDAVFAIAMTILVLELHVPDVAEAELPSALLGLTGPYLTFTLSFAVVGMAWLSHHRKFSVIRRFDQNLLRLNLLVLLLVVSIALPTAVLGEYGDVTAAAVLYAASIVAIGLGMAALWGYAWRRRLVDERVDSGLFRLLLARTLVIPAVFLASIPVALLAGATAGELTWIVALPASFLPRLLGRRPSTRGRTA